MVTRFMNLHPMPTFYKRETLNVISAVPCFIDFFLCCIFTLLICPETKLPNNEHIHEEYTGMVCCKIQYCNLISCLGNLYSQFKLKNCITTMLN